MMFGKKALTAGKILATSALVALAGCTGDNNSVNGSENNPEPQSARPASNNWAQMAQRGVIVFFDSLQNAGTQVETEAFDKNECDKPILAVDSATLYFNEMKVNHLSEGVKTDGVCGDGIRIDENKVESLRIDLVDSIPVGTVEFYFRPNEDFNNSDARTLLGNDESRLHFMVSNGELIFQKNHADIHYFVKAPFTMEPNKWYLIAAQWGDGYMSLFVDGKLLATVPHDKGYVPSTRPRPFGNMLVAGFKSECCMEGAGIKHNLTTSGSYDQVRISNITRYNSDAALPESSSSEDPVSSSNVQPDSSEVLPEDTLATGSENWDYMNTNGVAQFFRELFKGATAKAQIDSSSCDEPSLAADSATLFFNEMEKPLVGGKAVDGVCGKGILVKANEVEVLNIDLKDSLPEGTVEFFFRPNEDFNDSPARTILGNDESRVHFVMADGKLFFQKNLDNKHITVGSDFTFEAGKWYHIAGQWDNISLSLYVDGKKLESTAALNGYSPSTRDNFGNMLLAGFKSECCMNKLPVAEGKSLSTSGTYDQVRVSNILRF